MNHHGNQWEEGAGLRVGHVVALELPDWLS